MKAAGRLLMALVTMTLTASCIPGANLAGITASVVGRLRPFSGCDELLSYLKDHALEHVTAWGLPGTGGGMVAEEAATADGMRALPAPPATPSHSQTNVQTAGIDEPDIVKTDGARILALAQGRLFLVDVSGSDPKMRGSLALGDMWVRDLFLVGDRALLLGESGGTGVPEPLLPEGDSMTYGGGIAVLAEVDLSDPERMRITRRLLVDGRYLSARMAGPVARVVMSSPPTGLAFEYPEMGGLREERDALRRNREIVRESSIEDWIPYFVLEDGQGRTEAEGMLLDCAAAHHPPEFSGFTMLSVVTLDLSEGLTGDVAGRSTGVLADGETVYASAASLYVGTQRWMDPMAFDDPDASPPEGHVTRIHRFDISGSDRAVYRSSGDVPGWLLNQFSMDEHDGFLRVASTDAPPWWGGSGESEADVPESMVTVLTERNGRLVDVGRVAGLGKDERIFAVRFLGDLGYVVTFREVDPLYVVDLSDPTRPRVTGELKIPGYSAYLHPIGDGLLLGVGQDATKEGVLRGTQVSLFDVSDPAQPRRVALARVSGGSSEVEWDHHAFLYWEPTGLAVLPLNVYRWDEEGLQDRSFHGAMAVRVREGGLEVEKRLDHDEDGRKDVEGGIRRALVIGDALYTVSERGVEAADLATLEDTAWVPFR
ncbi:MAG: beta-propeller domain-containing protein [Actinomycetota bacterium]|nr:beta-propeller domain-containing protein [Actinomycetota bacterium]